MKCLYPSSICLLLIRRVISVYPGHIGTMIHRMQFVRMTSVCIQNLPDTQTADITFNKKKNSREPLLRIRVLYHAVLPSSMAIHLRPVVCWSATLRLLKLLNKHRYSVASDVRSMFFDKFHCIFATTS